MKKRLKFILIPVFGYLGFWLSGCLFFLLYFKIFNVPMDLDNTGMIKSIPSVLSIFTVLVCSFLSFFLTTKIVVRKNSQDANTIKPVSLGFFALSFTIALDLLITVGVQNVDIFIFPVNLMYLLAWLVIIPAILLAWRVK